MGRNSSRPHFREQGVRLLSYAIPKDPVKGPWVAEVVDESLVVIEEEADNLNALIDQAEDPDKMLGQTVADMKSALHRARKELIEAMGSAKRLEKKEKELEQDADGRARYRAEPAPGRDQHELLPHRHLDIIRNARFNPAAVIQYFRQGVDS